MYVVTYETSSKWTLFNMRFTTMFITAVCVLFFIKLRWPKKKSVYDLKVYDMIFIRGELHIVSIITWFFRSIIYTF